jgi:hypothetical protein
VRLIRDVVRVGRFTPVASYQRFAYGSAAVLVVSGAFHSMVFLVDGGSWEGPVSWRKPIVFGLSFGISLLTLAWIAGLLRVRRTTGWVVVGVLTVASVGEVVLVSMQTWRGVPSHFNESTNFDSMVFSMMGMLVALIAVMTVVITVRSFASMDAPPSLAWSVRSGLVLMLVSQAVGVQMIIEQGNTFGAAGALKVPHAFTLHVIQVLPAIALLLLVADLTERRRLRIVGLGAIGYGSLIASTLLQAYGGRSPLDLDATSTVLAVAGIGLLAVCAAMALRAAMTRREDAEVFSA